MHWCSRFRLSAPTDLWPTRLATRLAKIGLAGGIVSILALAISGIAYAAGINPTGACGWRLIVPPIPAERLGSETSACGVRHDMLVDVVAVLVLVLMAADVFRMLFIDTEPQRDPARRDDS